MLSIGTTIEAEIYHNCIMKKYPDGRVSILCAERPLFREAGWELADGCQRERIFEDEAGAEPQVTSAAENLFRAKRRARSAVRDLALSNLDLDMFVTFTLDAARVDRYDVKEITRKLNVWLDNRVRRQGLKYILVPELHKDGAVHFHGLINSLALAPEDSGTLTKGGKPRKPRSAAQRRDWLADGWQVVYNLPDWTLGFSTGISLYGERDAAVSYVCKYIAKSADKVGGRWYYHGGELQKPSVVFLDADYEALSVHFPHGCWKTGDGFSFVHGFTEG